VIDNSKITNNDFGDINNILNIAVMLPLTTDYGSTINIFGLCDGYANNSNNDLAPFFAIIVKDPSLNLDYTVQLINYCMSNSWDLNPMLNIFNKLNNSDISSFNNDFGDIENILNIAVMLPLTADYGSTALVFSLCNDYIVNSNSPSLPFLYLIINDNNLTLDYINNYINYCQNNGDQTNPSYCLNVVNYVITNGDTTNIQNSSINDIQQQLTKNTSSKNKKK